MNKIGWIVVFCLGASSLVQAQSTRTVRVKDGEEVTKAISNPQKYLYPEFQKGRVVYLNGNFSAAMFNYNLLLSEVQFINPKGDTLSLAAEAFLQAVEIGEKLLQYHQKIGYLEVVGDFAPLKLGTSQKFILAGTEKVGAYNQSTGASAIRNTTAVVGSNSQMYRLQPKGDMLFSKEVAYFLIDQNNQPHRADKAGFLRVFPLHKKAITGYLKENSLNLNQEEDLRKLLQYCLTLRS